jgi:hypothetical protein
VKWRTVTVSKGTLEALHNLRVLLKVEQDGRRGNNQYTVNYPRLLSLGDLVGLLVRVETCRVEKVLRARRERQTDGLDEPLHDDYNDGQTAQDE